MQLKKQFISLSGFYFFYFAFVGVFSPFWGLYLNSLSFSAWQISVLMSLSTLARIVSPGLWGWLADHQGKRRPIIIWTSILSAAFFAAVGFKVSFWWIFATLSLSHLFWAAALPLVEATTAELTAGKAGQYSSIRVWGSIGFVVLSVLAGYLTKWLTLSALPWIVTATLVFVAWIAFKVPEAQVIHHESHVQNDGSIWETLKSRPVIALFLCCFLMAFAHGPYYTFYSIGLQDEGFSASTIGWMWSIGVMAEILAFWQMPKLMKHFSLRNLMMFSLVIAILRFSIMAFLLKSLPWVVFAQALHAITFAVHHATAIGLINAFFARRHQGRAQGMYIVAGFGVGGSVGGLLGGLLWPLGGPMLTFSVSAAAALLGVIVCYIWLKPEQMLER